jgi:hypothetical protein
MYTKEYGHRYRKSPMGGEKRYGENFISGWMTYPAGNVSRLYDDMQ